MSENEEVRATKGSTAWDRERGIPSARAPKPGEENKVEDIARKSKLNAEAQEFVPQCLQVSAAEGMPTFPNLAYQRGVLGVERGPFGDLAPTRCFIGPVPSYRYPVVNLSKNLAMPLPIQQYPIPFIPPQNPSVPFPFPPNQHQHCNGFPPTKFQEPTPDDMNYIAEVIQVLSHSPGRYQEFITPIEDIVETYQNDERALEQVIDRILQQCVLEQNFRYTGGRICKDLTAKFGVVFVKALLARCQDRFAQLDAVMASDRPKGTGFAMMLAELYQQVKIGNGHVNQLGQGVMMVLNKFLNFVSYDVVRCVVQIIKLCGVSLEKTGLPVQPIFEKLEELARSDLADENCQRIIAGLMHLRRTEWANLMADAVISSPPAVISTSDEPVFYSPDGQVMSEEERSFLLEQIMPDTEDRCEYVVGEEGDDMDEETYEAFVQFVNSSTNNHKNQNEGG